jgi:hypothetical protein
MRDDTTVLAYSALTGMLADAMQVIVSVILVVIQVCARLSSTL